MKLQMMYFLIMMEEDNHRVEAGSLALHLSSYSALAMHETFTILGLCSTILAVLIAISCSN